MPLPFPPQLTGDVQRDISAIHTYLYDIVNDFDNAVGSGIDPSIGQGGQGSLTIVDNVLNIVYTPGVSTTVDSMLYGFIDISFDKPDRVVDVIVFYRAIGDVQFKQSYASMSPFKLISLRAGVVYQCQMAGQAANGALGPLSPLVNVTLPLGNISTAPPNFSVTPTYQSIVAGWDTTTGFALLEYQLQVADDVAFTINVLTFVVYGNDFIYDTGIIGVTKFLRVRSVNTVGVTSAYTNILSTTTLNVPDDSILYSKIQNVVASRLLLRGSAAGSGDVQEGTVGNGLQISGTTLSLLPTIATFTITATGFTTSVTGTARYVLLGTIVILFIPSLSGTSNATTLTLTGLPSEIQPTQTSFEELRATDNGIDVLSIARLNIGSGTIDLFTSLALGAWTVIGTKTVYPLYICYHRS